MGRSWSWDGKRIHPRLADVPDDDVRVWADAFDEIDDANFKARVGDLLWCRKHPPAPHERARAACRALVQLGANPDRRGMEGTEGLVRALEIARELSDKDLLEEVVTQVTQTIRAETRLEDDRPGIPYSLLRGLVDLPASSRPPDLEELIKLCKERYGADPHQFEAALELQAAIAAPDELPDLRRRQVERWRNVAGKARRHPAHELPGTRPRGCANKRLG